MRVLVTGCAGFIGFHLCARLLREGHDVLGVDNLNGYYDPQLKTARLSILQKHSSFRFAYLDICDAERLRETFGEFEPQVVAHLAAQAGVRYSLEAPELYVQSNVCGTQNLLEICREYPLAHLLFASTSSVYGANVGVPYSESDRTDHQLSVYAATKKAGEALCHAYASVYDMPITCFRFFTVYGPWGRPDMALFKFTKAILAGQPVEVYGGGDMSRDFTYIDDLVEMIIRLIPVPPKVVVGGGVDDGSSPAARFRVVNLGLGYSTKLMDFVEVVEQVVGRPAVLDFLGMQPGDMKHTLANANTFESLCGSIAATPLRLGVEAFVDWYTDYFGA